MYEELVNRLKSQCYDCKLWDGEKCCLKGDCKGDCSTHTRLEAADVIKELQRQLDFENALAKCWEEQAKNCREQFQKLLKHRAEEGK